MNQKYSKSKNAFNIPNLPNMRLTHSVLLLWLMLMICWLTGSVAYCHCPRKASWCLLLTSPKKGQNSDFILQFLTNVSHLGMTIRLKHMPTSAGAYRQFLHVFVVRWFTFYSHRGIDMRFQLMRNMLVNWYFIKITFSLVFFLNFEFIAIHWLQDCVVVFFT